MGLFNSLIKTAGKAAVGAAKHSGKAGRHGAGQAAKGGAGFTTKAFAAAGRSAQRKKG